MCVSCSVCPFFNLPTSYTPMSSTKRTGPSSTFRVSVSSPDPLRMWMVENGCDTRRQTQHPSERVVLCKKKKALPVVCWVGRNVGTVFVALRNFNFISIYKDSPKSVGICEVQ